MGVDLHCAPAQIERWRGGPGRKLWSVLLAAERNGKEQAADNVLYGLCGLLFRAATAPVTLSDIHRLAAPGLASLGIEVDLIELPRDTADCRHTLRRLLHACAGAPLLQLRRSTSTGTVSSSQCLVMDRAEQTLARQAIAVGVTDDRLKCVKAPTRADPSFHAEWPISSLHTRFTHIVRIKPGSRKAYRFQRYLASMLRCICYHEAHPEYLITALPRDSAARKASVEFLRLYPARNSFTRRLSRAADLLANREIVSAYDEMKSAIIQGLGLAPGAEAGLLSLTRLTGIQRSELIYLARAGGFEIRVICARRLSKEKDSADARRTLEALATDPEPWVRAAASL
ncbi:MAG TPA: hypothetical protein VGS41_11935 [Chthonomonadales bacterium]|nr:hypothetical protein [Chthonomonadales bacterium]